VDPRGREALDHGHRARAARRAAAGWPGRRPRRSAWAEGRDRGDRRRGRQIGAVGAAAAATSRRACGSRQRNRAVASTRPSSSPNTMATTNISKARMGDAAPARCASSRNGDGVGPSSQMRF
jgi:hypothetical protein